ncbi:hypothetical protein QBC35DRAFT_533575 [Podospora australis]|uniref:Uncharacterized protein n=1 Tax=Podospora australis TaxID=1536484 RepID=A0AAN6WQ11_9PEZI|nr:hypothetical protein QBC35DRAFT_533575 [Podospora australis]
MHHTFHIGLLQFSPYGLSSAASLVQRCLPAPSIPSKEKAGCEAAQMLSSPGLASPGRPRVRPYDSLCESIDRDGRSASRGRDTRYEVATKNCNVSDPSIFRYASCSDFIECVVKELRPIMGTDLNTGTTLVGLLPTILLLLAPAPLDFVQQGLVSPHRALAISCFSIGLPTSLFARLQPLQFQKRHLVVYRAGGKRVWHVNFAALSPTCSWTHVITKVAADLLVIGCAVVMMWRSWVTGTWVMVQWSCESPMITFLWPLACMFWLVVALLLLGVMAEDIRFTSSTNPPVTYTWWDVLLPPYTLRFNNTPGNTGSILRNWVVYETTLEILSGVVYFYSTMAWLSSIFLGAVGAMVFVASIVATYIPARIVMTSAEHRQGLNQQHTEARMTWRLTSGHGV